MTKATEGKKGTRLEVVALRQSLTCWCIPAPSVCVGFIF